MRPLKCSVYSLFCPFQYVRVLYNMIFTGQLPSLNLRYGWWYGVVMYCCCCCCCSEQHCSCCCCCCCWERWARCSSSTAADAWPPRGRKRGRGGPLPAGGWGEDWCRGGGGPVDEEYMGNIVHLTAPFCTSLNNQAAVEVGFYIWSLTNHKWNPFCSYLSMGLPQCSCLVLCAESFVLQLSFRVPKTKQTTSLPIKIQFSHFYLLRNNPLDSILWL